MLINNAELIISKKTVKEKYLLVTGGKAPDTKWLKHMAEGRIVVCADSGVCCCKNAGIVPDYLIGDADSAGNDWQWAVEQGVPYDKYPVDKDETDMALALQYIIKNSMHPEIVITGVWGGRFDHAYVNACTALAVAMKADGTVVLADDKESMIFLVAPDDLSVFFKKEPEVISVLPFSDSIKVSAVGTLWEMKGQTVEKADIYTISNRLKNGGEKVNISLHEGQAGIYFLMKN